MRDGTTRMKGHVVTYPDEIAQLLASDIKKILHFVHVIVSYFITFIVLAITTIMPGPCRKQNKSTKLDFTQLRRNNQKCFFFKQKQAKSQTVSIIKQIIADANETVVYMLYLLYLYTLYDETRSVRKCGFMRKRGNMVIFCPNT